jgi:hypothetical protein
MAMTVNEFDELTPFQQHVILLLEKILKEIKSEEP